MHLTNSSKQRQDGKRYPMSVNWEPERVVSERSSRPVGMTSRGFHDGSVGEAIGEPGKFVCQSRVAISDVRNDLQDASLIERHDCVCQFANQIGRKVAKIFRCYTGLLLL